MSHRPKDLPDALWHLTARVNWQVWHLAAEFAYRAFLRALRSALDGFQVDLLAFVLMSNHFHLVLRSPAEAEYRRLTGRRTRCGHWRRFPRRSPKSTVLGQFTRQLQLHVANAIQEQLGLKGHFWEARHHRRRILDARQLVYTIAYDHRNPVKENMVSRPEDFARSSAAWWAGEGESPIALVQRPDPLFGLDFESLRAAVVRHHSGSTVDAIAKEFGKSRLRMDSPAGATRFSELSEEFGLAEPISALLP